MKLITGRPSHLTHPSNRLYRGEVRDFRDAAQAYLAALRDAGVLLAAALCDRESVEMCARWERETRAALAEYESAVGAAERALFARWQAEGTESARRLAEAALAGDYARLAI